MSNSKPKLISIRLEKWIKPDTFSKSFFELREYLDGLEINFFEFRNLRFEAQYSDGDRITDFAVYGDRWETPEEVEKRLQKEKELREFKKKKKKEEEEKERKEYERLKQKFGDK